MLRRSLPLFALVLLAAPGAASAAETTIVAWGDSITYGYFDGSNAGNVCTTGDPNDPPYHPPDNPPETCGYPGRLGSRLDNVSLFDPIYDVDLLNLGAGGEKTASALSRMDRDTWPCPCSGLGSPCPINSLKYWVCNGTVVAEDLVVIMEGTNDVTDQISGETIKFNLESLGNKAEALGLNVILSTLTPRHPDGWTKYSKCANDGDADAVALNDRIEDIVAERGWPLVDPYGRLAGVTNLFTNDYQNWLAMRCNGNTDTNTGDPVGHPDSSGFNKMTYDATGSTYLKTFESVVRSALPPRLTLSPPAPITSGVAAQLSVVLHDLATYPLTVGLSWDFGDGTVATTSSSSSPAQVTHTFWYAGQHEITVTAEHPNGGTRTRSVVVDVALGPNIFLDGFESGDTSAWIEGNDPVAE